MPHYSATVRDDRSLELPLNARQLVRPGQLVDVDLPEAASVAEPERNEKLLSTLDEIVRRQASRRQVDGSHTDAIIREGRAGAMYGDESS